MMWVIQRDMKYHENGKDHYGKSIITEFHQSGAQHSVRREGISGTLHNFSIFELRKWWRDSLRAKALGCAEHGFCESKVKRHLTSLRHPQSSA